MTPTPLVLAVYGTLRGGERNERFLAGSAWLGTGIVLGRLYDMPASDLREYAYPALVLDEAGAVAVELYHLPDEAALVTIDELEAFDPADEAASQYVRRSVSIVDGPLDAAWVYVYNGTRADLGETIDDGDWVAHRKRIAG